MTQIRQVCGVILYNAAGEVLLQQRDDKPDLRYAGYWTFFGGAVEDGEHPDDAIVRELAEELALEGVTPRLWHQYECPARTVPGEVMTYNFMYHAPLPVPLESLTLYEGQAMRFFPRDEALKLDLAFMQTPILQRYFEQCTQEEQPR